MNNTISDKLKKRTFGDLIFSIILSAVTLALFIYQLAKYFHTGIIEYSSNSIYTFALFVEFGLLTLILREIRKNGKPFSRSIIIKLRIMGILLMVCGLVPTKTTVSFSAVSDTASDVVAVSSNFDMQNFIIIFLGVVIGIVSEVFVYGCRLQEDNDLIA